MSTTRISDLSAALRGIVTQDARRWAGADNVISRKDEKKAPASWRPDYIKDAASDVRAHEAPGGRVTVREVSEHMVAELETVWRQLVGGADDAALTSADVERLGQQFPALAVLTAHAQAQVERNDARGNPERVDTLAQWQQLPANVRRELLEEGGAGEYANLKSTADLFVDEVRGARKKAYVKKMIDELWRHMPDAPEDDWGLVGQPKVRVSLVTLPNGEIAGGRAWAFQQGFDREELSDDDAPYHFDNAAAARDAGYDPTQDISWQGGGVFDHDGAALQADTYWEWTGW